MNDSLQIAGRMCPAGVSIGSRIRVPYDQFPMERGRYAPPSLSGSASRAPAPADLESFGISLRLFAARRVGDWAAAEDVAQEVLRVGLEAIRAGRIASSEALPGFLFQTAVHVCMHRGRSAGRQARALERVGSASDAEPPSDDDPLEALISAEREASVRGGLARLDADERRLLEMSYGEEMSSEEIGRRLGLNPGAVRVRRHRAIRRLAELLRVTKPSDREFKE
jgi:RNA polymerase sigma-70 factor (ECF subfamily)